MDFVAKHLSDPFYLDGIQRVSLRDKIFREIVANLLVHREYTDARPATLIIYRDLCTTPLFVIPVKTGIQEVLDNTGYRLSPVRHNCRFHVVVQRSPTVIVSRQRTPRILTAKAQSCRSTSLRIPRTRRFPNSSCRWAVVRNSGRVS
jgi:hypothetical protein